MSKCLVTTLTEPVSDESLLKIDELKIHVEPTNVAAFKIAPGEATILGDGYFTNADGTANYGKSMTWGVDAPDAYISPGSYDVVLKSKYAFNVVYAVNVMAEVDIEAISYAASTLSNMTVSLYLVNSKMTGNINTLLERNQYGILNITKSRELAHKYPVTGNLEKIGDKMQVCQLGRLDITGDLSHLSTLPNLTRFDFKETKITGNLGSVATYPRNSIELNDTLVTGNISSVQGMTPLTNLSIARTSITGNLSSLAGLTNLQTLDVSGTSISGDTSSLANLTNLTYFYYGNTAITGTWPLA